MSEFNESLYFRDLNRYPTLSQQEEEALLTIIRSDGPSTAMTIPAVSGSSRLPTHQRAAMLASSLKNPRSGCAATPSARITTISSGSNRAGTVPSHSARIVS